MSNKIPLYPQWVQDEAKAIGSDGCTVVSELFHSCCLEHDCAYRHGRDPRDAYRRWREGNTIFYWDDATPVTRAEADKQFKRCIQAKSAFGKWSLIALGRWAAVRAFGWWAWRQYRRR